MPNKKILTVRGSIKSEYEFYTYYWLDKRTVSLLERSANGNIISTRFSFTPALPYKCIDKVDFNKGVYKDAYPMTLVSIWHDDPPDEFDIVTECFDSDEKSKEWKERREQEILTEAYSYEKESKMSHAAAIQQAKDTLNCAEPYWLKDFICWMDNFVDESEMKNNWRQLRMNVRFKLTFSNKMTAFLISADPLQAELYCSETATEPRVIDCIPKSQRQPWQNRVVYIHKFLDQELNETKAYQQLVRRIKLAIDNGAKESDYLSKVEFDNFVNAMNEPIDETAFVKKRAEAIRRNTEKHTNKPHNQ